MEKRKRIIKNTIILLSVVAAANIVSFWLFGLLGDKNQFIISVYILAVSIIARWTDGYLYGVLASLICVISVNFFFTYPYMAFNFILSGYPVAFICMLLTSILISALTATIKQQENIKIEAEKERMRANLLRSLSHDIRTPLTTISGVTNALLTEDKLVDSQRRELLLELNEDAVELIKMVENILSITKVGGETSISKSDELIEDIIGSAIHKFKKNYPDIEIEENVPDEIILIKCDPKLIEQVLINLLENAAVHGKHVTKISVSFFISRGFAHFSVSDDGAGIDADVFPRLFQDYVDRTKDEESADQKRNMGIGLAVCSTIVRAHGGKIWAENTGRGAKFEFTLPFEEDLYEK